jgi:hypothetical protein
MAKHPDEKDPEAEPSGADGPAIEAGSSAPDKPLPILYRRPIPLIESDFAGLGYTAPANWEIARNADFVPLTDDQFAEVAGCYPILFAAPAGAAVCVLGVRRRQNLFVDSLGDWAPGYPIPNYIRRYPFIMEALGGNSFRLCADRDAPMFSADGAEPLFSNGEPSPFLSSIKDKCAAFEERSVVTRQFCRALIEADLLVQKDFVFRAADGGGVGVTNLSVVDKSKLDAMDDGALLDWYRNGYLSLIHCHLLSLRAWPRLLVRSASLSR